jgi:hypothetical protein
MNLTEEQLSEIEQLAGLFFAPEYIAVNLEMDEEQTEYFVAAVECNSTRAPGVAAFIRGRLSTEIELRKAIKQSALNGSSPSQQMMLNYLKESRK